jgi:hypothetical protein
MDERSYPLHRPVGCSHQMMGQGFMSGAALSRCAMVGGHTFLRDASPPWAWLLAGVVTVWISMDASLGYGILSSIAKPFFEGASAPTCPHAVTIRLRP